MLGPEDVVSMRKTMSSVERSALKQKKKKRAMYPYKMMALLKKSLLGLNLNLTIIVI